MALDLIDRTKSLEILTAVQHDPDNITNLFTPSWVPRWDYFVNTPILGLYNSKHFASCSKGAIVTPPLPNVKNTRKVHYESSKTQRSPRINLVWPLIAGKSCRIVCSWQRSTTIIMEWNESYNKTLALIPCQRRSRRLPRLSTDVHDRWLNYIPKDWNQYIRRLHAPLGHTQEPERSW